MLVLNKDRIKEICNEHGVKLGYVIEQMGVSRSHFENMTHAKVRGDYKLEPVVNIGIDMIQELASMLGSNVTDITINLKRYY